MRPVIQTTSEEADHAHSGCVANATVAVAPPPVTASGAVRVTAHFAGEGPVDVATVEPHPPAAQANTHAATYTSAVVDRRREGRLENDRTGKRIPWCISGLLRLNPKFWSESFCDVATPVGPQPLELVVQPLETLSGDYWIVHRSSLIAR